MAYEHGRVSALLVAIGRGAFHKSFLRSVAGSALTWDFQTRNQGSVRRVTLQQLVKEPIEVRLAIAPQVWGETPVIDLVALNALVRLHEPRSIFEFGTFTGHGTLNLCLNAPLADAYTIDLSPEDRRSITGLNWEKHVDDRLIGSSIRESSVSSRIKQLHQDSRELDTAPFSQSIDFVFVDGGHEPEFVESDSRKAFEMVSPHGVIAWHDFSRACPGVERYVTRLAQVRELFQIDGTQIVFCYGEAGPPAGTALARHPGERQSADPSVPRSASGSANLAGPH